MPDCHKRAEDDAHNRYLLNQLYHHARHDGACGDGRTAFKKTFRGIVAITSQTRTSQLKLLPPLAPASTATNPFAGNLGISPWQIRFQKRPVQHELEEVSPHFRVLVKLALSPATHHHGIITCCLALGDSCGLSPLYRFGSCSFAARCFPNSCRSAATWPKTLRLRAS